MFRSAFVLLAALTGCHTFDTDPSTPPVSSARTLDGGAVTELTKAFQTDAAAAKSRYNSTRWRFKGVVQWANGGTGSVTINDVGECTVAMRGDPKLQPMKPGEYWEFDAAVDNFNPATVGGIAFREVDLVGKKPYSTFDSAEPGKGRYSRGGPVRGERGNRNGPRDGEWQAPSEVAGRD